MTLNRTVHYSLLALAMSLAFPVVSPGQPDSKQILERLDRLERENDALREQLRALREEVHASAAPTAGNTEERLSVQERRTEELAQTKVETSQRFPIRLTG